PVALALLREILRAPLSDDERRWLMLDADQVLGLDLDRVWATPDGADAPSVPAEVTALVEARERARATRDWAKADALRAESKALGWEIIDRPQGPALQRAT
ncbi:MAG: cysteinyl-tRNA synthetase, partial [Chloroflexota bacterium]|nr:cysteinyl-tRNA synthetase [Chloroflexota bacterium]